MTSSASLNIQSYSITNQAETLKATLINIGASLTNLYFKGVHGDVRDIVLGLPTFEDYLSNNEPYFGCVVGRVAGRVKDGLITIDGKSYNLDKNDGPNSLHGGRIGFSHLPWTLVDQASDFVKFSLISNNGDSGYPGTLKTTVEYRITASNELVLNYEAKLINDENEKDIDATVVNLTNHTYFNLDGFVWREYYKVHNHIVEIFCDQYLEKDVNLIPTGRILSVNDNRALNFLGQKKIKEDIRSLDHGYDDCYLIPGYSGNDVSGGNKLIKAATVYTPTAGIEMTLSTTEPAFQFYTANFLGPTTPTKHHQTNQSFNYGRYYGFCMETQRHPNAANVPDWSKHVILRRGQLYKQTTVYSFEAVYY